MGHADVPGTYGSLRNDEHWEGRRDVARIDRQDRQAGRQAGRQNHTSGTHLRHTDDRMSLFNPLAQLLYGQVRRPVCVNRRGDRRSRSGKSATT